MIQKNVVLKPYTNYKIGGKADFFIDVNSEESLLNTIEWSRSKDLPFFLLGGGTNIIVSDMGIRGVVIHNNFNKVDINDTSVFVGSGVLVQDVLDVLVKRSILGLEWAGGLPGSIGGAIHGNAGAFGGYISEHVKYVRALSPKGNIYNIPKDECNFSYRSSIFKEEPGWVILGVFFEFAKGNKKEIEDKVEELREWRRTKHPLEYGNCGSVFKRISVSGLKDDFMKNHPDISSAIRDNQVAIAYFIDQCGLKEKQVGGVRVSSKHPNFFVNFTGEATAQEVIILINIAKHAVMKEYSICLEEEVEFIGFDSPVCYNCEF